MSKTELLRITDAFGQSHLLDHWDRLDVAGRAALEADIREIDFALINDLYRHRNDERDAASMVARAVPAQAVRMGVGIGPYPRDAAVRRGEEALAAGQIGVVLVAGGQGTRLGFPKPKGMYPIGPISGRSLFQILFEMVIARRRRHGARIPLALMTSSATHHATEAFLAKHGRFGLADDDLRLFRQGAMPAVAERDGKILLAEPRRVALSPDGHGGLPAAMLRSGVFDWLRGLGVRHLFYLQVDNPLVDLGSPEFLGYHLLSGSQITTRVIAKRRPGDRVGNAVTVDGRLHIIEYSDLSRCPGLAERRNPDGSLWVGLGSIAVHAIDVEFLAGAAESAEALPYHVARKKVGYFDPVRGKVKPDAPNAIKFERFIFDLIPQAERSLLVEIDPGEHFGPLKNGSHEADDTPELVRGHMLAVHHRWLRRAGVEIEQGVGVEVSPLYALDADELKSKIGPMKKLGLSTYFC